MCRYESDVQEFVGYSYTNKVIVRFNVFSSGIENRVSWKIGCPIIFTLKSCSLWAFNAYPHNLSCCIGHAWPAAVRLGCADDDASCMVWSAMAANRSTPEDVHNAMTRRRRLNKRTSLAAIIRAEPRTPKLEWWSRWRTFLYVIWFIWSEKETGLAGQGQVYSN